MHIEILAYHPNAKNRIKDLKEIFFDSSGTQSFSNPEEKEKFFDRWAGVYLRNWPDDVYFCCDSKTDQTLGYLLGCRDTAKASLAEGTNAIAHYPVFARHYLKYPAHLHLNTSAAARGRGVGTFLIREFILDLKKSGVKGVHAITEFGNKNNSFYRRNLFKTIDVQRVGTKDLVFYAQSTGRGFFF